MYERRNVSIFEIANNLGKDCISKKGFDIEYLDKNKIKIIFNSGLLFLHVHGFIALNDVCGKTVKTLEQGLQKETGWRYNLKYEDREIRSLEWIDNALEITVDVIK